MPVTFSGTTLSGVSTDALVTFDPTALFRLGEPGAWYDPSDMSSLFQDAAGTTPVTAVEQPVGLMLDKSRRALPGPELVTNGDFATNLSGWTVGASYSWVAGRMYRAPGAADGASQNLTTVAGRVYRVTFTYEVLASLLRINWGGAVASQVSGTGTTSIVVVASGATTALDIAANTTSSSYYIDNISVREISGNYAFQTDTNKRPVLSARVNLLTRTEEFNDAVWSKESCTVSANAIAAPNGTTSADKIISANATAVTGVGQVSAVSAAAHTGSLYVKADGARYLQLLWTTTASTNYANFDLQDEVVTAGTYTAATIAKVTDDGWYRIAITSTLAAGNFGFFAWIQNSGTAARAGGYTGDGTSGIYLWGADLRVANDGVGIPAYQRVTTATDYDTTNFPMYLRFDGTDDALVTNAINFTGTDKVSIYAGGRKVSDAAVGIFVELSTNTGLNNGTFVGVAPDTAGTFTAWSRGDGIVVSTQVATASGYPAPITFVYTATHNIPGDLTTLRINTVAATNATGNKGAGNFGNYPLYIGSRAGTSFYLNGRIYNLIVRGAASSATEITAAETYVNSKTKAY